MVTVAPYGTWQSPIGADLITKQATTISEIFVDPVTGELFHSEQRPEEEGRIAIVRTREGKDAFGREWNARSGVHEYGGAASTAFGGKVYFSDAKSRRIHVIDGSASPTPVTPDNNALRYANIAVHPVKQNFLVAVQEDHTKPDPPDVINTLAVINTNSQSVNILVQGADFYSTPVFSPGGSHIAWLQWTHPDMPWEGAQLWFAEVVITDESLQIANEKHIAGKKDAISTNEPSWVNDDILVYQGDTSGFYNPQRYSVSSGISEAILPDPVSDDFSEPAWQFGWSRMAVLDEKTIIASPIHLGFSKLVLIDLLTRETTPLENPFVSISLLRRSSSNSAVMVGVKDDSAPALIMVELSGGVTPSQKPSFKALKEAPAAASDLPPGFISRGKPYVLKEGKLHTIVTPPLNPYYVAPEDEKPPAVVNIHGGPTGRVNPGLSWITQYFTSRGWTWVDVNYTGSAGYGREYREHLRGNWGVADVADAADCVKELGNLGLIDSSRAMIRGGSAGGYTTLMTLCTEQFVNVFAAGTSSYGISDLTRLAGDTHKFESHYLFKLVGGTPQEVPEIYEARSPLKQAGRIRSPLLILQGSEDKVVPPNQAEAIVEKIREQGGRVEYVLFQGEGHGWRKAENIKKALETERQFYEDVLNLTGS